jgi:hypothetical protein
MTTAERPPYRLALWTGLLVLLGYLLTLAPTVTFWDAGELIASANILGIPHPPGTPLWVLVAHVWGKVIPFGDYAWRLNLMSAVGGAIAASLWFLVGATLARRLDRAGPRWIALGAGFGAALFSAFGFTNWQNAVEAEVYSIAMVTIAGAAWCAVRWCDLRDERRGQRLLLVLLYLGAISIGNHLLALLIGPALVALLVAESWRDPLLDSTRRAVERSRIGMVAATWVLLIALGLGSSTMAIGAGVLVLVAGMLAVKRGQTVFVLASLAIVVVGMSPYLFLFLRAQQGPFINEADPSTWHALLDVIRRAQYPIRTPLDDPTVLHGPNNPGRTLTILGYQLANYAQYFDWQWARGLGAGAFTTAARLAATFGALVLGLHGAAAQWRRDRAGFWFIATFFAVTGLGIVMYMNFKPGPSIGWERWVASGDHEVRERDYFFVASFVAWSVWLGLGLATLVQRAQQRWTLARWPAGLFAATLLPFVLNVGDASRKHGPETTLARDFARALLDSVPPGGILFTWGDNDTFPLWHAQAVDGYRTDVTIVCLALAETPWYMRQLAQHRPQPVDREHLPTAWRDYPIPAFDGPVHDLTEEEITAFRPALTDADYELQLRTGGRLFIPRNSIIEGKDYTLFAVVRQNAGRRPVAWSVTAQQKLYGAPVIQQGLALVIPTTIPDTAAIAAGGPAEGPLDMVATRKLIEERWQFGELLTRDLTDLEPNVGAMARTLALPYARLGVGYLERGDTATAMPLLEQAAHLAPSQTALVEFVRQMRDGPSAP